jgi:hypothetical protein
VTQSGIAPVADSLCCRLQPQAGIILIERKSSARIAMNQPRTGPPFRYRARYRETTMKIAAMPMVKSIADAALIHGEVA